MPERHNDFILVDQYLSGDRKSGELLFADTYKRVKAFVLKNTSKSNLNEEEKNDIISESLYIAIEKLSVYNGTCAFSTFAISIAKNVIKTKYRKKGLEEDNVIDLSSVIDLEEGSLIGRSPEHVLIKKEEKEIILKAINMLSKDHKDILLIRVTNNMKFKQIGELSGVGEDAVRKMFGRAVISFKKNLEELNF